MTQSLFPFARDAFIVDLFAGGGGASEGILRALGRHPDVAVNHDADAIDMHRANHPETRHYQEDVFQVDPVTACGGRQPDLLWASPDCKHFSKAKGGKPRSKKIRGLAWVVVRWAEAVRPRCIAVENVEEFQTWGPLDENDRPIKERAGETFRAWVQRLEILGYTVEWQVLRCSDFGAPTDRRRLFIIARLDGPPRWPERTHGDGPGLLPHRTALDCIDFSIPCPSIFLTREEALAYRRDHGVTCRRPLAEKTMRRIAAGVKRYVLDDTDPCIVELPTGRRVIASMVQSGYGERKGQRPRTLDIRAPLGTVVAGGSKHALVCAWIAKHYGGVVGIRADQPLGTITTKDHHAAVTVELEGEVDRSALAAAFLTTKDHHAAVTVELEGEVDRSALAAAFLTTYYSTRTIGRHLMEPMPTVTTKDRFGVVVVHLDGEPYRITDIGMRMLTPRECANGQGFGPEYKLTGTKTARMARVGNSVPPDVVAAIVAANVDRVAREVA